MAVETEKKYGRKPTHDEIRDVLMVEFCQDCFDNHPEESECGDHSCRVYALNEHIMQLSE